MAGVNVTFPGNLAQVQTAADLRAIPSTFIADGDLYLVNGLQGLFEYDPGSVSIDDGKDIIRPYDKTPLQAGRWIRNVDGLASGPQGETGPANSTYTSLILLKAAPSTNKSYTLVTEDGRTDYAYINGDFTGRADDLNVVKLDAVPLSEGALVRQGAQSVAYTYKSPNAPSVSPFVRTRSIEAALRDGLVNVHDFMEPSQVAAAYSGVKVDMRDEINDCFDVARQFNALIEFPANEYWAGVDENNPLRFNIDPNGGLAPAGIRGRGSRATTIGALPGSRGTLLKSVTVAGKSFAHFGLTTFGTPCEAWDCSWMPFAGPSVQTTFFDLFIAGGSAADRGGRAVSLDNMNDSVTSFFRYVGPDLNNPVTYVSCIQAGGSTFLRDCEFLASYLKIGTQNGTIDGIVCSGIELASPGNNAIKINGGQFYGNVPKGANVWSSSFNGGQGSDLVVFEACKFINLDAVPPAYFNVNLTSGMHLVGCSFEGFTTKLLSDATQMDPFQLVKPVVRIEGGSCGSALILNDRPTVDIVARELKDASTGYFRTKNRGGAFVPTVRADGATNAVVTVDRAFAYRNDNVYHAKLDITWTYSGGAGSMILSGFPGTADPSGISSAALELHTLGNDVRALMAGTEVRFFDTNNQPIALPPSGRIILSALYDVIG